MTMSAFGGLRVATSAKSRVRLTCTTLLVLLVLAFSAGRFFPSDLRSDLDLIRHSGGVGDDQAAQSGEGRRAVDKWVQDEFKDANVVIWESAIHDEVIGAIGKALATIGITPVFIAHFRFKFQQVLADIVPNPETEYPNAKDHSIERRLAEGKVDVLILTTCRFSLPGLIEHIRPSTAHVVCFWHAGTLKPEPNVKLLMHELAEQDRLTMVTLGNEVQRTFQFKVDEWEEKEQDELWGKMPVEYFVPIFDWPADKDKNRPPIFPSTAIIQGNLENHRRAYLKTFTELEAAILEDPTTWGYTVDSAASEPVFEPIPDKSPFKLQLMGQLVPNQPLAIPDSLKNVVSIHSKLDYPDYYRLLSNADILLPAFAQSGYYFDTASSSIAAGVIGRVPILGSHRLSKAYDYVEGPARINRDGWTSEIATIKEMRLENTYRIPDDSDWLDLQETVAARNSATWSRIVRRAARFKV